MDNPATIYVIDTSSWGQIKGDPAQAQIQECIFELIDAGKVRLPPAVMRNVNHALEAIRGEGSTMQ